jgi:two-component sensor histidine kinase
MALFKTAKRATVPGKSPSANRLGVAFLEVSLRTRRHPVLGYGLALILFLAAFGLHWETSEHGFPFITFIPAVMLATLLGGKGPGIAAAILSGLASWYFFLPPVQSFKLIWPNTYGALTLYTITVAINIAVIETMYRALDEFRAEKARTATMFHELQHRIANNLQFVGSMLSIQTRKVQKDPTLAEAVLDEASRRLTTMARIHRRLYDPGNAGIEFRRLLEELGRDLVRATGARNVTCHVDMPPIDWEPDRLITLALLVTEIMTNSLKHAFDETGGTIHVTLVTNEEGLLELTVADNGRGLPDDFDPTAGKSLGMQIIQGLVNQIGGTLEITGTDGTVTRIVMAG